jgi:hypothetical protein
VPRTNPGPAEPQAESGGGGREGPVTVGDGEALNLKGGRRVAGRGGGRGARRAGSYGHRQVDADAWADLEPEALIIVIMTPVIMMPENRARPSL